MASNHGSQVSTFRNEILAALSDDDIKTLRPALSRVSLVSQQVLHERATPIADVFFMENGIASLAADTLDEGHVEVGLTGWEGFVGASVVLNPDAFAVHRAFVQVEGSAYRMSAVALRTAINRSDSLRDRCLRYVDLLMVQTSQAAACNARHNLPERLARWLLITRDRVDTDHLPVTQEFLSIMLGVRRAGVLLAASTLQAGGLMGTVADVSAAKIAARRTAMRLGAVVVARAGDPIVIGGRREGRGNGQSLAHLGRGGRAVRSGCVTDDT